MFIYFRSTYPLPKNFGGIACFVAELNPVPCLVTRAKYHKSIIDGKMSIYEYVCDVIHINKTIITVDTLFYILQTYLKISVTFSIISCRRVSFSFKAFLFSSVLILCLVNSSLSCSKFFCLLSSFISLKSFRSTRALKNELVLVLWGCKPRYWVQFPVDVMNHFQFSTLVSRSNFFSHLFLHSSTVNTPFPTCHPNSKYCIWSDVVQFRALSTRAGK